MNIRHNQRYQQTHQRIQNELLSLLSEYPLEQISVRRICTNIGINPSTFYQHFESIYDLSDDVDTILRVEQIRMMKTDGAQMEDFMSPAGLAVLFRFMEQYQKFYRGYITHIGRREYLNRIFSELWEENVQDSFWPKLSDREADRLRFLLLGTGICAVLEDWLQSGCAIPADEIAQLVSSMVPGRFRIDHPVSEKEESTFCYRETNVRGRQVRLVSYPILDCVPFVRAAFTTREGGVSSGPYSTLNLGLGNADSEKNKRENYRIAAEAMGCTEDDVVLSHQFHTTTVRVVTEEDRGKGTVRLRDYEDVDGLVTNVPGILLVTLHADCTPLYFVDPVHRAIGLAHSGWRGTVQRMGEVMLQAMAREYSTDPKDVIAVIGPTISVRHYEIGPEVAEQFEKEFGTEICKEKDILRAGEGDRSFLNLEAANRFILEQAGVPAAQISASGLCTYENADRFFSHRAVGGGERGNCAAMLVIRE